VAVAQLAKFACGLKTTEFFYLFFVLLEKSELAQLAYEEIIA
jgi:hypothetical protein